VTGLVAELSPKIDMVDLLLLLSSSYVTIDRYVIPVSAFCRGQATASPDP